MPESMLKPQDAAVDISARTQDIALYSDLMANALFPAYQVNGGVMNASDVYLDSTSVLNNGMTFYCVKSCMVDDFADAFHCLNEHVRHMLCALYALRQNVCYGILYDGAQVKLVLGVPAVDAASRSAFERQIRGYANGGEIEMLHSPFASATPDGETRNYGIICPTPHCGTRQEPNEIDYTMLVEELSGIPFTLLFFAKPVEDNKLADMSGNLLASRDAFASLGKQSVNLQRGVAITEQEGVSVNTSQSRTKSTRSTNLSLIVVGYSRSKSDGTESFGTTITQGVSTTANENIGVTFDSQNSMAQELQKIAEQGIDRLNEGRSCGLWNLCSTYASPDPNARNIIRSFLYSESAKGAERDLPAVAFQTDGIPRSCIDAHVLIPKGMLEKDDTELHMVSRVTSNELAQLFMPPIHNVSGFDIQHKPCLSMTVPCSGATLGRMGWVCDNRQRQENMPFTLSEEDINRHVFATGKTGSGKTTAIKRILRNANKPFWVIEGAKTEYRDLNLPEKELEVFTLGLPGENCPRFNPLYVQPGVHVGKHISSLASLFIAAFGLIPPLPSILTTCLVNVYRACGWDTVGGGHPLTEGMREPLPAAHVCLCPTLEDLLGEIERYVDAETHYEGEVKGNIRSALIERMRGMCQDVKGYMFNTHEILNMSSLLRKNVIFEMEHYATSEDQAFFLGLLLIWLREYVSTTQGRSQSGLKHILVIEEAHRLLSNVQKRPSGEADASSESLGQFAAMLAEIRSYGEGVIVAEQIASKLLPDVYKNTNTKLVFRTTSGEEQQLLASEIRLRTEDAVQLTDLPVGCALLFKDAMARPAMVQFEPVPDLHRPKESLSAKPDYLNRRDILEARLREAAGEQAKDTAARLLNSLLLGNVKRISAAMEDSVEEVLEAAQKRDRCLPLDRQSHLAAGEFLAHELVLQMLFDNLNRYGLPGDELAAKLEQVIAEPAYDEISALLDLLRGYFRRKNLSELGVHRVVGMTFAACVAGKERDPDAIRSLVAHYSCRAEADVVETMTAMVCRDLHREA